MIIKNEVHTILHQNLSYDLCPVRDPNLNSREWASENVQAKGYGSTSQTQLNQDPVLSCLNAEQSQSWTNDATITPTAHHCLHVTDW